MALFEYKNNSVYYIIEGKGKPILLLNGIMMTTDSWEPIAGSLRAGNTLIRVDMLDQGKTTRQVGRDYDIKEQSDLIKTLIEYLDYQKISLVGISYGGYVGINFAGMYPDMVDRLVLTQTAASTTKRDAEMFKQFIEVGETGTPYNYYLTTIPLFYSENFYQKNVLWMEKREKLLIDFFSNKEYRQAISRLAKTCLTHDARALLKNISAPTLVINGADDTLLPINKQIEIAENVQNGHLVSMYKTGHVAPYESPLLYTSLILGFINNPNIEFKI